MPLSIVKGTACLAALALANGAPASVESSAASDWSYLCLGMKHGCVLAQHTGTSSGTDGFYNTLTACENSCPQIGKELSWECTGSGNCVVASSPPNVTAGFYPDFAGCSNAPGGRCLAPGTKTISYECHGAHFGCVPKNELPDEKTKFASIDDCEAKCHVVPSGMSFGCAGSRPTSCVLLDHAANPFAHYYGGIERCNSWCNGK